jgi:DNA-binding protein HU-beta
VQSAYERLGINVLQSKFAQGIRMNKAELVDAVASAANLSKADAGRAVDAVVNSITSALKKGQQVSVVGFGTFGVKHRAARSGRNPRTGETIQIAASNVPGFKAGKALKDAVN